MEKNIQNRKTLPALFAGLVCILLLATSAVMAQDRNERFTDERERYQIEADNDMIQIRTEDDASNALLMSPRTGNLSESFEGTTFPPAGWSRSPVAGGFPDTWGRISPDGGAHDGSFVAASASWQGGSAINADNWLITPRLSPSDGDNTLSFFARSRSSFAADPIAAYVSTDGNEIADFSTLLLQVSVVPDSWTEYTVDLSDYDDQDIYIAFRHQANNQWHIYLDSVTGPALFVPETPAISVSPLAFGGVFDINPSSSRTLDITNTGGTELTVDFSSASAELAVTGFPLTIAPGETESATVVLNAVGLPAGDYSGIISLTSNDPDNETVDVAVTATILEAIVSDFLFEDFESTAAFGRPAGWTGGFSVRDTGGIDNSKRLTQNLWSNAPTGQFTTSFIEMGENPEMSFFYRAVNFTGYPGTPTPATSFAFTVFVSTDFGASFEPIWVYDPDAHNVSTNYAEVTIDVSDYANQTVLFGVSASRSADDFWLDFDNFSIGTAPELPPSAVELNFPSDEMITLLNPQLNWTHTTSPPTNVRVFFDSVDPPLEEVFDGSGTTFQTSDLAHGTTYYWNVVAYNDFGDADPSPTWSFTTVGENDLAESFENTTFPPAGWANPGTWSRSTFSVFDGAASASKFVGSASDASSPHRLRTPMLTPVTGSTLEFAARSAAFNENIRLMIEYSDDGDVWTTLGTAIELPQQGPWELYSFDLSSLDGDDYFLSFSVYSEGSSSGTVYLDYVRGPEITSLAPNAVTLTGPADEAEDVSRTPELSWTADGDGGIPAGYRVYLDTNPAPTTEIADVASSPYTVSPALDFGETYYWKVVAYNSEGVSPDSEVRSFTTMDDPTITDFPYSERFPVLPGDGSASIIPELPGWIASGGTWNQRWQSARISGTGWVETVTVGAQLFSPPFDIPEATNYQLSFWHRTEGSTQEQDIDVYLSNDGGENYDVQILELEDYTNTTYTQVTFDLSAYAGETIQLRFRKTGGNTTWGWAFDDLFIGPAESSTLFGQEGFFLISNPLEQNPIGNLLAPFWTQGFTGSDFPGADDANVFTYNETTDEYTPVSSANTMVSAGSALAVFVYDDDNYDGTPNGFPKNIMTVGPTWSGDIEASVSNSGSGWNLIGNPFTFPIDLFIATEGDHYTGITGFFYRYNNAMTRWEVFDAAQPGVPDTFFGLIERFEGFFVEANAADPEFTFKEDLEAMPIAAGDDYEEPGFIRLKAQSDSFDGFTNVVFLSDHTPGRDGAKFLYPLTTEMTSLFTVHENDAYMMRYIDRELGGEVSIPVAYYTTDEGEITLSWDISENIPADWTIELLDTHTGELVDLLNIDEYVFEIGDKMQSLGDINEELETSVSELLRNPAVKSTDETRFVLNITMTSTNLGPEGELPAEFALRQNYPNPFNPTTQISYDLPESADVRLEVFNVMGQRVATLVNTTQNAGTHNLTFDASRLASGVYIYRLQAGSNVFTKKMTLVK